MSGYWTRHRLLQTIIFSVAVAIMVGLLFVAPVISQQADNYNSQSIYKNTGIDFVAPEPSFEQVNELPGTNGISKVFPFYMTSIQVSVNGKNRTTNVILSDQLDNIDFTMYSDSRIIEQLSGSVNNPLFVDWQFCHDTGADLAILCHFLLGVILSNTRSVRYMKPIAFMMAVQYLRQSPQIKRILSALIPKATDILEYMFWLMIIINVNHS